MSINQNIYIAPLSKVEPEALVGWRMSD